VAVTALGPAARCGLPSAPFQWTRPLGRSSGMSACRSPFQRRLRRSFGGIRASSLFSCAPSSPVDSRDGFSPLLSPCSWDSSAEKAAWPGAGGAGCHDGAAGLANTGPFSSSRPAAAPEPSSLSLLSLPLAGGSSDSASLSIAGSTLTLGGGVASWGAAGSSALSSLSLFLRPTGGGCSLMGNWGCSSRGIWHCSGGTMSG